MIELTCYISQEILQTTMFCRKTQRAHPIRNALVRGSPASLRSSVVARF